MIKPGKIFFVIVLMISTVNVSFSQNLSQQADTLKANSTLSESDKDLKDRTATETDNRQTGANGVSNGIQTAKQVRGGRPDMSKARGARPPLIIRPSGSGIPKGAGKPGGAGRYGGR
ncbi:MAG: hypothetical protein A2Y71_11955 [Bacteroidetes bacterium RBG_13_42_15]|jgi:hypothetical protein|nr:MAG: hypothetical protein A2Y71_11955 [Bacteroidetes bacterium RBG_13_42_15]